MFDVMIKNGFVIDGTGAAMSVKDIAITGDVIAEAGRLDKGQAAETIDAEGSFVCPGFIDIHSHSDFNILVDPPGQSKIRQGITTEVCGNCGLSAAPLFGMTRRLRKKDLKAFGMDIRWSTLAGFVDVLGSRRMFTNIAPLVGHGNLRGAVLGYENRSPSELEMGKMANMLAEALETGAWGLSSGLVYPPGVYAERSELVRLAGIVEKFGGIYASHIRSEGDFIIDAIDEAVTIGKHSGVSVQISHLKTMGKRNWNKLSAVFERIEQAIEDGVSVSADRYPYIAASTGLDSVFPSWACQGGRDVEIERLQSSSCRNKIFGEVLESISENELADKIIIARVLSENNKVLEGKTLGEAAEKRNQALKDALFDILVEEDLDVDAIFFLMSRDNLKKILLKDYVMFGSDSSVWDRQGALSVGKPHPRCFGTFPRAISEYVFEKKVISIEKAIKKMTGQPAEKIGIADRGVIKEGNKADIVIFNKENLKDNATYEDPHRYPSGIMHVMVNGKWIVKNGAATGKYAGCVLLKNMF